jgi:poly [ADP-ribose] polymerase
MAKRIAKLILVSEKNNNKYYDMVENDDGSITSTWGRVDVTENVTHYPVGKRKWETLLKSKLKKGYKDKTHLRAIESTAVNFTNIKDRKIKQLVDELQGFANTSVKHNYTVASEVVTQKQIDEAQDIIDVTALLITSGRPAKHVNDKLLELYSVIPRKMKKVQHHLIEDNKITRSNIAEVQKLVATEQATLDVMKGQVVVNSANRQTSAVDQTILDAVGIEILLPSSRDIAEVKKQLGGMAHQYKKAYKIVNRKTQAAFDRFIKKAKNKKVRLFWHGSRNENWWSILDSGLLIRPAGAVLTGAMFGYGIYGASKARKSSGYTSLRGSYWASGNANKGFMGLFSFHIGNQLRVKRHSSWMYDLNYANLQKRGNYDSLYAEGGADLRNDEFIVYMSDQATVTYLVEIGN